VFGFLIVLEKHKKKSKYNKKKINFLKIMRRFFSKNMIHKFKNSIIGPSALKYLKKRYYSRV